MGGDVVDVDLQPEGADVRAVQRHRPPGAADRARVVDAHLLDQPPVEELDHQVGDGGPVQARGLRDVGPGGGAVLTQVAQDQREVRPAERGVARGLGRAAHRTGLVLLLDHAATWFLFVSDRN